MGAASAGIGILGSVAQNQQQAASIAAANARSKREYENALQVRELDWRNQLSIWSNKRLEYKNTVNANSDAAGRGYAAEQMRMNEAFQAAAFQKQGMLTELIAGQGALQARGQSGQSLRRADNAMLAAYGRNNATMASSLTSSRSAAIQRMEDIRRQLEGANNAAYSSVALAPTPGIAPPAPILAGGPSPLGMIAGIGGSLMKGYQTYQSLKAPSAVVPTPAPQATVVPPPPTTQAIPVSPFIP